MRKMVNNESPILLYAWGWHTKNQEKENDMYGVGTLESIWRRTQFISWGNGQTLE